MKPIILLFALASIAFSDTAFELKNNDTIALLGDSFIEREQYEGWIELAVTTQFADRKLTFRNLGWSADTPAGESRNGLSLVQAGYEPPEEGWRQLLNQLATYKPNVILLGYGMAASLPGGSTPDQFEANLNRLLDEAPNATGGEIRFLILGTPPTNHQNKTHLESLGAINQLLRKIATARELPYVSFDNMETDPSHFQNPIHLSSEGYKAVARHLEKSLGWTPGAWDQGESAANLRQHILKKNDWFFHRSRPANMAYIFGFRKREQGNNAGEILEFDKLVADHEALIAKMRDLSTNTIIPLPPERTESTYAKKIALPYPAFTVADGFEITLWAENPMLHKPTQMNFDPAGRLWVASSETYPQVEVGQTPNDKIIVLRDTNGDGKADESTVFAEGMLMPTGLLPGDGGVYVGQSTDLLHFKDTNGDGKGDQMTRVLSGFGTEDTHHNLHTLRRGPDGRIWMNQSIYTRTDSETPNGLFRLKSGGIMRFDPRSLDLQTVFYGWCNAWGHQFDRYGQSFLTDGAGGDGINWGVPDAMYFTYARAPKILGSISPGSYPKFCGLEIIESPHFPGDWQGNMVTCDFRAHRIVRFSIADQDSGYVTQELGDLVRSSEVNFRPIDVKIGPDGALYIADWANPVINHGEVDFRDPRRDREHGRIWRVSKKDSPTTPLTDFTKLGERELLEKLTSDHRHERAAATTVLFEKQSETLTSAIAEWKNAATDDRSRLAALWISQGRNQTDFDLLEKLLASETGEIRAAAIRILADSLPQTDSQKALSQLKTAIADPFPRVRIEAIRALAKIPDPESFDIALDALDQPTDRFIDYALWLSVQFHGKAWLASIIENKTKLADSTGALEFVLAKLPAPDAAEAIAKLLPSPLPQDGSGPWLDLALKTGNGQIIAAIYEQTVTNGFDEATTAKALNGISQAISQRQIKLEGDRQKLLPLLGKTPAAIRLAGTLQSPEALPKLISLSSSHHAIEALGNYPNQEAKQALETLVTGENELPIRHEAALALTRHHRSSALPHIAAITSKTEDPQQSRNFWQALLTSPGISKELAATFKTTPLSAPAANLALQHIPDVAEHDELLKTLREQAGQDETWTPERIKQIARDAAENGDPHRGELIYRRPALACVACHAIGGAGGKVGPDMTSLGASAPTDYIVESIVLPGAKIKEGYHSLTIETKDGRAVMGQLVRSGGGSHIIRDASGNEITIADSNIAKKTDAGSLMPANLINGLPEQEVNDLFKFLFQLGKPGDFDATKTRAPKVWAVHALSPATQTAASRGDPSVTWFPINATVAGYLLPDDVKALTQSGNLILATKLQLAEETEITLEFSDGLEPSSIWINGEAAPEGRAKLPPGIHTIALRTGQLEKPIRIRSEKGTFLPE